MTARMGVVALLGFAALLSACGGARRDVPLVALDRDPELRRGREVFDRECHSCHPGGASGLAFAINDRPLPGWLIALQVRHGLGAMPAFPPGEISERDLDALVAYVKWLRHLPAPSGDR